MKKFIKTVSLIFVVFTLLPLNGCKKFLETELQGNLTQQTFPETQADALMAVNATYQTLRDWYYNSGGYPILDIMSDDARKGSNPSDQASTVGPYDNFSFSPTQDGLDRWWNTLYVGVKRANVVIERVPGVEMDGALKNRYIAEARFLRGLFYFDFLRAWGGVPLVTTLDPPQNLAKASKEDIQGQILADLTFASENLPFKNEYTVRDLGRATKGSADAMLARYFLWIHDFQKAEEYALRVINSNLYDLEPEFVNANGAEGENGIESVFEVGAIQVDNTEGGGNQYANTQGVRGTPNRGWGFNRPSMPLRNAFEEGDPRFKGTIIDLGDTIDGVLIVGDGTTPDETKDPQGNVIEVESYNRKVWVPGTDVPTLWAHNRRLIRYADVLLMAAEALNENGKAADALTYLNRVRERARQGNTSILPDITTTDQGQLRQIIYDERRKELALEGWRFWDLIRTGRAPAVLGPLGFIEGKNELLPIPQTEIDLSQGSLTQNPGW